MASRSVNKVILLGRLGKDAETKFTPSGSSRTTFSLATSRNIKDGQTGEWKEETDWHNVVLWKSENIANYLQKGKQIYVEGRLSSRSYDDKDGVKRYITEVVGDNVILLGGDGPGGGRGGEAGSAEEFGGPVSMPRSARKDQPAPATGSRNFEPSITDDDVPF
ncbi:MAG: single-stranded DNA-binding protein [Bryobacteraceae bacterium]|nr:single-stranded DNA-binding protein [Bryobacteraceae bacterium]